MNRFLPESWPEAILRPLAMAFPDAWVYIEVMAPDVRFVLLLLLLLATLVGVALRADDRPRPVVLALTAFTAIAFVPWLATTGNGRYFIPVLLSAGVVCVSLIHGLPTSRQFRLTLAVGAVLVQGLALFQNSPWQPGSSWAFVDWRNGSYLSVDLDQQAMQEPATYVGVSVVSYSLVAPQFPETTRWINLSALQGAGENAADVRRARAFLAQSRPLRLIAPAFSAGTGADGLPTAEAVLAIDRLLTQWELAITDPLACRVLKARTGMQGSAAAFGFWVCPLGVASASDRKTAPVPHRVLQAFERLERLCPRRFPPGQSRVVPMVDGFMRHYQGADMKVYVTSDQSIFHKHHRAISAKRIGQVDEVLRAGFSLDCEQLRPGSGLPWSRQF